MSKPHIDEGSCMTATSAVIFRTDTHVLVINGNSRSLTTFKPDGAPEPLALCNPTASERQEIVGLVLELIGRRNRGSVE